MNFIFDDFRKMPSGWNEAKLLRGRKLTDADIRRYEKRGWYTAAFKDARRELMAKKLGKRTGNFVEREGKLIFSPV